MRAVVHGGLTDGERLPGVVDLSANLHPDGPTAAVRAAVATAEIGRYPAPDAAPLREAIGACHGVPPDMVVVTPGAAAAIALVTETLLPPGSRCGVFEPTFGEYRRAVEAVGARAVSNRSDPPAFAVNHAAVPSLDAAWLCLPNNPTGCLPDREDVAALSGRVPRLFVDAAYIGLADGAAWDPVTLVREGHEVVVVGSLTKLFAMPGIRLGYAIAAPPVAARLRDRQPPWPVGAVEIAAGRAALAEVESRRATVPALLERRAQVEAACAALGLRTSPSRANFALIEVGDARRFRAAMLARGFGVRDGTSFGLPAWVRIAAPAEAVLPALLDAIAGATAETRRPGV